MTGRIPEDAFDFYVGLGSERSYRAVADHYGVTKRAITKLAAREGWAERLANIEQTARELSDQRLAETLEEVRSRHLKTLRAMNARALAALQQYPLTSGMEAMRAAETVIKLERLIVGEPSERTEISVEEATRREVQTLLEVTEDDDAWDEEEQA